MIGHVSQKRLDVGLIPFPEDDAFHLPDVGQITEAQIKHSAIRPKAGIREGSGLEN